MKQRIMLVGRREGQRPERTSSGGRPGPGVCVVRPLRGEAELAAFARARRRAFVEFGLPGNDAPFDATRGFTTTLGAFAGDTLVAGISVWRLSDSFCSLGYLLGGVGIEKYPADRVVEVGGLFAARAYRGRGVTRQLLEATRVLLAGMAPRLVVAFAVEREAERLVGEWGFAAVGPAAPHPFSPAVRVVPLVAPLADVLAARGGNNSRGTGADANLSAAGVDVREREP
jgi:GNAT superfamily N-acetyltransferase